MNADIEKQVDSPPPVLEYQRGPLPIVQRKRPTAPLTIGQKMLALFFGILLGLIVLFLLGLLLVHIVEQNSRNSPLSDF